MRLLQELITLTEELNEQEDQEQLVMLFEDLGKLRDLGLGRMINAFKQSYRIYDGKHGNRKLSTDPIGNQIVRHQTLVGRDSEAVDIGVVRGWKDVKKAYKDHPETVAFVLYLHGKASVLVVSNDYKISSSREAVGISWDLTGTATAEQIKNLAKNFAELDKKGEVVNTDDSHIPAFLRKKPDGERTKSKSQVSLRSKEYKGYDSDKKEGRYEEVISHYQGISQTIETVKEFVDALAKEFSTAMTGKLILADQNAMTKRGVRGQNQPIEKKDLKLFTDDIRTRLAKYKVSKLDTVADAHELVKKVFSGKGERIKFAGLGYSLTPKTRYLGSSNSGLVKVPGQKFKQPRHYSDTTMRDLIKGREIAIDLEAVQGYHTLTIYVKFKEGQLVPTKVMYYDDKDKRHEEVM